MLSLISVGTFLLVGAFVDRAFAERSAEVRREGACIVIQCLCGGAFSPEPVLTIRSRGLQMRQRSTAVFVCVHRPRDGQLTQIRFALDRSRAASSGPQRWEQDPDQQRDDRDDDEQLDERKSVMGRVAGQVSIVLVCVGVSG